MHRYILVTMLAIFSLASFLTSAFETESSTYSNQHIQKSKDKRAFTVEDLHNLKRVGGIVTRFSAPLNRPVVAFSTSSWDSKTNKKLTSLYVANVTASSQPQVITDPQWGRFDVSPQFCPGGREVMFLSSGRGSDQSTRPYIVDSLRGESSVRPLSGFQFPSNLDIDNLIWSRDGRFILFSARIFFDCGKDLDCTSKRLAEQQQQGWKEYDQLYIRHWDTWEDHRVSHMFLQRLKKSPQGEWMCDGAPVDLMDGMNANSPVPPFGGTEQIAVSNNGQWISLTLEQIRHDTSWRTDWNVALIELDPTSLQVKDRVILTPPFTLARNLNPVFSDDSTTLYFGTMKVPKAESDKVSIVKLDLKTRQRELIAENWDRSVNSILPDPSGRRLLVSAEDDGHVKLFSISLADQSVHTLINEGSNGGFDFPRDRNGSAVGSTLVFSRHTFTAPIDVWMATYDFSSDSIKDESMQQVTKVNGDALSQFDLQEAESFHFPCEDPQPSGVSGCQGWILRPPGFSPTGSAPVAFLIHGGPEGAWDSSWSYRWNPQLWAARGYVVIMVNPHGSTGFGIEYTRAVLKDWGGKPYQTLMKGLDYALTNFKGLNSERVGACGASYGGYMSAWIATQTNRFKSIAMHDGVFDSFGMWYSTEELFFQESEWGGPYWESKELYEKFSPSNFIENVDPKTQHILVIHGGRDYRIPDAQGIGMFTALQRRGVTSKLLYFPEENHWVLRQKNSIKWYHTVLDWMDQWV